jgi:hypothetical protein
MWLGKAPARFRAGALRICHYKSAARQERWRARSPRQLNMRRRMHRSCRPFPRCVPSVPQMSPRAARKCPQMSPDVPPCPRIRAREKRTHRTEPDSARPISLWIHAASPRIGLTVRGSNPVQPGATPCNAMQPGATARSIWKNEPTAVRHARRADETNPSRVCPQLARRFCDRRVRRVK